MNEASRIRHLLTIVFVAFLLLRCAVTDHTANKPVTKIVYSFKDASVPPQYHRSYTIIVTRGHAHIVVDSYGDIHADEMTDIPEQRMEDLARHIETCRIREKDRKSDTVCTGGTSKSLTVYSGENIILNGTVYSCGGRWEGNLTGDIDSFAKKIEDLIPDFANLLK